jgi:predicted unusual protein kinase regulating ubiquinone biosynthesis (AarF/ABC1/UbiB family)
MERVEGVKATLFDERGREQHAAELSREFIEAYLKQIAIDGVVHSDPHAGNFLVDEGGKLTIMDFGMVVHVDEKLRGDFVRLLISYAEGDAYHAAETLLDISTLKDEADVNGFRNEVSHLMARDQHLPPEESLAGLVLMQMAQVAYKHRIQVPSTTTMLGKTMMSMSAIAQHLDSRMDLSAVTRQYLGNALLEHRIKRNTPGRFYRDWGELEQMVTYAPMRINRILDIMSDNQLQVKVTSHETEELLDGLQKIANRVAFGIIDGSLIIGAALVMQYDVGPRLFGYPLISTLCFFAAAALGLYLLISMLLHDRHP